MKIKLPLIGQIATGKDTLATEKIVERIVKSDMGAAFLDLSDKSLSSYKTISDRLLQSFNGWVYANVSVLAEEISKMEFELYKIVMRNGEIELQEVESHPLLDLLDRFNDFTTTSQAMYLTEVYQELAGDTFIVVDGNGSNIKNLFLLQPDKVAIVLGDPSEGNIVKQYVYTDTIDGKQVKTVYEPEQILHIKTPNPTNPYRGKSVVEASAIDIDTDNLAQEMLKMFFKNGATPSVVLTSESRITKDDIERIQLDLKRTYGGVRNAFKSMILGNGLKPVALQQTAKEMQYLEIEMAMRDKIMAMFKNTKSSLGIVEDVNRANAEASMLNWKQSVIKPKMQRIVDTLNEFLVPRYGENLILSFCDPVPENRQAKIDEATALKNADIITLNEAREILDYDQVVGGDTFTLDTAPEQMPEPLKRVNYRKHFRQIKLYEQFAKYKELHSEARKIAEKAMRKEPVVARSRYFTNEQINRYVDKQTNIVDSYEENFVNKIKFFLDGIEEKAINKLNSIKSVKKAVELFDYDSELQAGVDLFTPLQAEIAKLSGLEANALLNLNKGYIPSQNLKAIIQANVKLFTKSMLATDQEKLSAILADGLQQGQSIAQITASIREQFASFKTSQTNRVARSEILRASNAGAVDAWKESGVVSAKQWVTVDPCEYCAPLEGKIVGLDEEYFSKGDSWLGDAQTPINLDYDSIEEPPLHPNCKCSVVPVLKDVRELDFDADNSKLRKEIAKNKKYIKELEKILEIDDEQVKTSKSKTK